MKRVLPHSLCSNCRSALLAVISMAAAQAKTPRLELSADSNWKFLLGDPSGAEARSFDDANWRSVDLPHDWSIEGRPAKDNPTGSGGGFYPAGTGWYRKTFSAPAEWKGKRVSCRVRRRVPRRDRVLERPQTGKPALRIHQLSFRPHAGPRLLRAERSGSPGGQFRAAEQPLVQRVRHLPACARGGERCRSRGRLGRVRHHEAGVE